MNCPSCQGTLSSLNERCPSCGAVVAPVVMGALAPDPARATPPARSPASLRELPALRKREKVQPAWKDEVRERMRQRRRRTQPDAELPLFPEATLADSAGASTPEARIPELVVGSALHGSRPGEPPLPPAPLADAASEFQLENDAAEPLDELPAPVVELRLGLPRPAAELPMRRLDLPLPAPREQDPADWDQHGAQAHAAVEEPDEEEWVEDESPLGTPEAVERPARFAERLQAGAVDAAILACLFGVVVYFASRAAHTSVSGLSVAWPWLAGYLAFLGLVYAAWFTGMRGQTPGKMLFGLLVLTQGGERPGWVWAVARAITGAAGIALVGLGMLPLFFDPARRALHDRLMRTRVVKV
jgi:uncharacterized RDD family membrane protein YckC